MNKQDVSVEILVDMYNRPCSTGSMWRMREDVTHAGRPRLF